MRFEKISLEQWLKDCKKLYLEEDRNVDESELENYLTQQWHNIKLPHASTKNSAGHDFYFTERLLSVSSQPTVFPTGIRWVTEPGEENTVLLMVPRSGLGFKYGMRLLNTVGVIDSDYYMANNEGHIMVKAKADEAFDLREGDRFVQGIIVPFISVAAADNVRTGGFGSTGK